MALEIAPVARPAQVAAGFAFPPGERMINFSNSLITNILLLLILIVLIVPGI